MPRTNTSPSQTSQVRQVQDRFAAFNGAAAETFARSCEACTNGTATLSAEMMSFVNTRLDRDIELGEAVTKCENFAGVLNLQQEWARHATQDYLAEASKLVQLATKLTQETWEPVYEQTNHMLTELNKS